jgi:hypothetical protein
MNNPFKHPKGCNGCNFFSGLEPIQCMLILEGRAHNCPCLKCLVKSVCESRCVRRIDYYKQPDDMEIPIDEC